MATIEKDRILSFRGQDLRDNDGGKIGSIEEIYLDAETNQPEWALVNTGLFGTKHSFVPLQQAARRVFIANRYFTLTSPRSIRSSRRGCQVTRLATP